MARKNIKRRTYSNFLIIYNALQKEKGYKPEQAGEITRNLFDTLEANPGGDIWRYYDYIVTAEEDKKRKTARKYADYVRLGLITMEEALTAVM